MTLRAARRAAGVLLAIKDSLTWCESAYEALANTDATVILTEWNEFRNLDFDRYKEIGAGEYFFDLRNIYDKKSMLEKGFKYYGSGSMTMQLKPVDKKRPFLVTGAAGFIGMHVAKSLLELGCTVIGLDNINDYYEVSLKYARLDILKKYDGFTFYKIDLADQRALEALFREHRIDVVINLAAQAGVRYSIENPKAYIDSNIVGFSTFWNAAGATRCTTCCMPHPARSTVTTKKCLLPLKISWITR